MSQQENNNMGTYLYRASAADFLKVPGNPITYWMPESIGSAFEDTSVVDQLCDTKKGMGTGDNAQFVRCWHEVSIENISLASKSREDAAKSMKKWFPYNNGGKFRKWCGNYEDVVNWLNDGEKVKEVATIKNNGGHWSRALISLDYFFKSGITWSDISSSNFSARYFKEGFLFSSVGMCVFPKEINEFELLGILNSSVAQEILNLIAPTMHYGIGEIKKVPLKLGGDLNITKQLVYIFQDDWDSLETSWSFRLDKLISRTGNINKLSKIYNDYKKWSEELVNHASQLETTNNLIYSDIYNIKTNKETVRKDKVSLFANPIYRLGNCEDIESKFCSLVITDLISYMVGCMMGRYSLDCEGLVYAHAGSEGFKAMVEEGAYAGFPADSDGILPLTSQAWFEDDIAARVEEFVYTVWGDEHLEENLQFIADSLCLAAIKPVKKGGETSRETIRRYFSTQFFKDHLKTYKKRPIYWLFSSGKEKAFECLVYLHRYNETTLPRMRTEYVTPLLGQIDSRIERLRLQQNEAETAEAKHIGKEIESLTKQLTELRSFDDQLKHYADMKIQLDLDDGVKVNYSKFGTLLAEVKAITGDKAE